MEKNPNDVLESLVTELSTLLDSAISNEDFDAVIQTMDRIKQKADHLKAKYPDYADYRMYHVLVHSTPNSDKMLTKFDFPEEDSIADFIRSL